MVVAFSSNRITYTFLQLVASSYVLVEPTVTINISRQSDTVVRSLLQFNDADLGTTGTSLTAVQQAAQPDTIGMWNC